MKNIIYLVLISSITAYAQKKDFNTKKGFVAGGYDVVSYFNNKAEKGIKDFTAEFDGVKFKFSSKENLKMFNSNPNKYVPQYGGYCAYAIGKDGSKVSINPKSFKIVDDKLYLFYNAWGTNTLNLWNEEGEEKLRKQADVNWQKLINN